MRPLRILYIEDIPDHVELVTAAMQPQFAGTQVESASAVQDAILCLQGRRYDVILANTILQGEPTIPHIREIIAHACSTPVIAISGDGDEKIAANAIRNGASDYLVKSRESLEVLPYLIQRLLKKKRHGAPENHPIPQSPSPSENMNHLMAEIEHVSRQIHNLQGSSPSVESAIASLREELRLLRQFAEDIAHSGKSRKSRH